MKSLTAVVVGSAASVLILSGFAFAQQQSQQQQQYQQGPTQQLTVREARQFMSGIERDINQMVQTCNLSRLRQWTQNNIADNAVLNRTNAIETEGQSRAISSITITKPDLLRLQRFVLSGMSDKLNAIEDFRLDIQVVNVQPVGDSAALVKSRISERARLAPRQGETGGRVGEQRESTTGQAPRAQPGEEYEDSQQRGRSTRGQQAGLQLGPSDMGHQAGPSGPLGMHQATTSSRSVGSSSPLPVLLTRLDTCHTQGRSSPAGLRSSVPSLPLSHGPRSALSSATGEMKMRGWTELDPWTKIVKINHGFAVADHRTNLGQLV